MSCVGPEHFVDCLSPTHGCHMETVCCEGEYVCRHGNTTRQLLSASLFSQTCDSAGRYQAAGERSWRGGETKCCKQWTRQGEEPSGVGALGDCIYYRAAEASCMLNATAQTGVSVKIFCHKSAGGQRWMGENQYLTDMKEICQEKGARGGPVVA